MSEYFFGSFAGSLDDKTYEAASAIAEQHDCHIVRNFTDGGHKPPRGWMAGPNRGAPFDAQMQRAVLGELEAAGLWPFNHEQTENE